MKGSVLTVEYWNMGTMQVRRCEIPSSPHGAFAGATCALEWGHKGDQHVTEGDGFYAREHDDEHHRRQREKRLAKVQETK